MFGTVRSDKIYTRAVQRLFAGTKIREFLGVFPAAGLQENLGGTSVTEITPPLKKGVASGDRMHPGRVFLKAWHVLSRQQVRTQQEHRVDGLWVLLRGEPEGVAHLRCHGQAFSWQL